MTHRPAWRLHGRGVVLVVVLWVLVAVTGLCLILNGLARSQSSLAVHIAVSAEADQALHSGLALAMAALAADAGDVDCLADGWAGGGQAAFVRQINHGTLVLFSPTDSDVRLGLADEAARLNANSASAEMLAGLPGFDLIAAERFVALRSELAESTAVAKDRLAGPAAGLTGPISTRVRLVELLDRAAADQTSASPADLQLVSRPWDNPRELNGRVVTMLKNLTIHTRVWNEAADGQRRVNMNTATHEELTERLGDVLAPDQIEGIVGARRNRSFESVGELLTRELILYGLGRQVRSVWVSRQQVRLVADRLTVTDAPILLGRVNVNTAPLEALRCLPGLDDGAAEEVVAWRRHADRRQLRSIGWLLSVLTDQQFAEAVRYVTTRSQQFRVHLACTDRRRRHGTYAQVVLERNRRGAAVLYLESHRRIWHDPRQ